MSIVPNLPTKVVVPVEDMSTALPSEFTSFETCVPAVVTSSTSTLPETTLAF